MTAFFSSNKQYPITPKPITPPDQDKVYRDIFNIQNTLRSLLRDLDTVLEGYVQEAPEDGKLYGRQDGEWEEITGGGGESGVWTRLQKFILTSDTPAVTVSEFDLTTVTTMQIRITTPQTSVARAGEARLFYNGDTNNSNYTRCVTGLVDGSSVMFRENSTALAAWFGQSTTLAGMCILELAQRSGSYPQAYSIGTGFKGTGFATVNQSHFRNSTDSVTSLTLQTPDSFPAGTVIDVLTLTQP